MVLRGKEIFEIHCKSLQENPQLRSLYGLKKKSTINTLKYFHVSNNYSFDIMHDLLEGVAQYEIKLLFGHLTHNFISEEDLLSRIYSFDYGFLERKNRPTKVILDSAGNSIGLNSIQTLSCKKSPTFVRRHCSTRTQALEFVAYVTSNNEHCVFTLSHFRLDSVFEALDC